jgi:hypothetical protein
LAGTFGGDTQAEAEHHERELRHASTILKRAIPDIEVRAYFVDFEAVWSVELMADPSVVLAAQV